MDWMTVANLIIEIGLPASQRIVQLWENKEKVTSAEFTNLMQLASQTAQDRMKARLIAAGVDLNSDLAKSLLDLTSAPPTLVPPPPTP